MYAIYAYIDPPNHPNVGIQYMAYMERLGYTVIMLARNDRQPHAQRSALQ